MAEILQFKSRAQLDQENREQIWNDWLEWEVFEESCKPFDKEWAGSESSEEVEGEEKLVLTAEEKAFLEYEERIARKEMMRNKEHDPEKKLELSPTEWDFLMDVLKGRS